MSATFNTPTLGALSLNFSNLNKIKGSNLLSVDIKEGEF